MCSGAKGRLSTQPPPPAGMRASCAAMLPQGGAGTFPEAVVRAQENIDGMWKLLVRLAALRDRLDELLHGPSPEATVAGADYAAGTRGLKGSLEHQAELLATIGGVFDQIEAQL